MSDLTKSTIAFVQEHRGLSFPIVFFLAFCESFAFISLVVPATGILLGLGGFMAVTGLDFWPVWAAATLGAIAGDWLAYDLASHFKDRIIRMWPFSSHPDLIARGVRFFRRWGLAAVFGGRFFGPFRAVVPLVAGLYAMPWLKFQLANFASAALWAAAILTPGFLSVHWLFG